MIESMFTTILRMSITSSVAVIVILLVRALFANKLPRSFIYAMWAIVLLRLLIPFSFTSVFSIFNVIPNAQVAVDESLQINQSDNYSIYYGGNSNNVQLNTENDLLNNDMKNLLPSVNPQSSVDPIHVGVFIVSWIWFIGTICLLAYSIFAYFRISNKLKTSVINKDNRLIYECSKSLKMKRRIKVFTSEAINTPVVHGFIRPRIILPCELAESINEKELKYIITHELIHIKRFDYIIKPLSVFALCIHWFNPLIWISFIMAQKDMEMSCDEKVLSVYNNDIRSEYALSLINISERQNLLLNGGLLAFGESNIKGRIKGIMKYNKKGIFIGVVAAVFIVILSLILLTDKETVNVSNGDLTNNNTNHISNVSDYEVNELLDYRSKYIGDASNVSNLLSKLPFGEYKNEITLQTTNKPYGITINYDFKNADVNNYTQEILQDNALILFSLIENVSNVTYNVTGIDNQYNSQYTRSDMQFYFDDDLWQYSKDSNIFGDFLKNISFKVSVYPKEYSLAMSIVPGIRIEAVNYNTDCNVSYSAQNGMFRLWNQKTGIVSVGGKTIELPYGTPVYWVPLDEDEAIIEDDILTISIINTDGNTVNEKQLDIRKDDSLHYTVEPDFNIIFRNGYIINTEENSETHLKNPMNVEDAVSLAIKAQGNNYGPGECITEGHIILDKEEMGGNVKVYTISSVGWFEFENRIFTKISGSGAIPTVMTFSINSKGEYILEEYKEPMDGSYYMQSLKEMFPENMLDRVLSSHDDYAELKKQQEMQASDYLKEIGKTAKVSADHVDKKLADIDVGASNKLFAEFTKYNPFLNNCPYWIGTREKVEEGKRYIYETQQDLSDDGYDIIIFKKIRDDGTVVEQYTYKIIGSEPILID